MPRDRRSDFQLFKESGFPFLLPFCPVWVLNQLDGAILCDKASSLIGPLIQMPVYSRSTLTDKSKTVFCQLSVYPSSTHPRTTSSLIPSLCCLGISLLTEAWSPVQTLPSAATVPKVLPSLHTFLILCPSFPQPAPMLLKEVLVSSSPESSNAAYFKKTHSVPSEAVSCYLHTDFVTISQILQLAVSISNFPTKV